MVMANYLPSGAYSGWLGASPNAWSDIAAQELGPEGAYTAAALGALGAQDNQFMRYQPRFLNAAMRGYDPSMGRYITQFGGETTAPVGDFTDWLQTASPPVALAAGNMGNWQNIVGASRAYLGGGEFSPDYTGSPVNPFFGLSSEYGNPLLMSPEAQRQVAQYNLGMPTRGIAGRAMAGAIGNQQDIWNRLRMTPGSDYFGRPQEGFLGWLAGRMPASSLGYVATPTASTG
jgi:hypothetical protein